LVSETKKENMTTLQNVTGKTEKEIKTIYTSAIETLVGFGATEEQARKIVKETFRETVGL